MSTKPVHRLQILVIMRNYRASPTFAASYIQVRARAVVWECGEGQTDRQTQTAVANIHFASAMPHTRNVIIALFLAVAYVLTTYLFIRTAQHSMTFHDNCKFLDALFVKLYMYNINKD